MTREGAGGKGQRKRRYLTAAEKYIAAMRATLDSGRGFDLEQALEVAEAADIVRGYEKIKMATVAECRARLVDWG